MAESKPAAGPAAGAHETRRRHSSRITPEADPGHTAPETSRSSLRDSLRNAVLRDLTMQERLLLVLLYVERMSKVEIAATLDLFPEQVDAMRERIIARLENSLAC